MIDLKNPDNNNEYDKIVLCCRTSYKTADMRYLCIEDLKNKCWIVYDSETGLYTELPFGIFTECVINGFISGDTNSVHYEKMPELAKRYNFEYNKEEHSTFYERSKTAIKELLDIFSNISEWRLKANHGTLFVDNICVSSADLDRMLLYEWKKYRYACFPSKWSEYISCEQDFFNEEMEVVHKIAKEYFIYYYDVIKFIDKNGNDRIGRSFVLSDYIYMYCWDLYHILVSKQVETPHICPRCKQLFFSNNNKVLYCDMCKEESNVIRNENRLKSVRYIHKKIYDKINNSKFHTNTEKELFLAESNYYWDIVRGKEVKHIPLFTANIKTEEDYKKWLEEKLKSI